MRAATLVLAAAACASPAPPPPAPLPAFPFAVELAGCATVLDGPLCEVDPRRPITLWVDAPPQTTLQVFAAGAAVAAQARPRERGVGLSLTVEPGWTSLEVSTPGHQRWQLALARVEVAPQLIEARRLKSAGELQAATRLLDATAFASPRDAARAMSLRARLTLASGELALAIEQLTRARAMHRAAHARSDEANDALVTAWVHVERQEPQAARLAIESAAEALAVYDEGQAQAGYYRGLAAAAESDARGALRHYADSEQRSARLGLPHNLGVLSTTALVLTQLGCFSEAGERLERLAAEHPDAPACDAATLRVNRAWALLAAREAGLDAADARPLLEEALRLFRGQCPRAHEETNVLANLALAALQRQDTAAAAAHLKAARRDAEPSSRVALWWLDLEGRLELARARPREALKVYQRLEALAQASLASEAAWRASTGQAEALAATGDRRGAIAALTRAEDALELEGFRVPTSRGLRELLDSRDRSARQLVSVLVESSQPREAFDAARRARARALRWDRTAERLAALSKESRERWADSLARYTRARERLELEAADDWRLPADRLARARRSRVAIEAELRAALDDALAALGEPPAPAKAAIPAGEVWLLAFPAWPRSVPERWHAFAATSDEVTVQAFELPADADEAAWAAAVLTPFDSLLSAAKRVVVLPYGALRQVDVHALPWRGSPLQAARPVAYALDLGGGAQPPRAIDEGALIVADPLGNLPHARTEGAEVAGALGDVPRTLLAGRDATGAALRAGLGRHRLLHHAGHGRLPGLSGWEAELPLADGRLLASDVLGLTRVPAAVVLSGCDTARAPVSGVEPLGLAHAFLAAGASVVVAATRPVDDAETRRLMKALYSGALPGADNAAELLAAAASVDREAGGSAWRAFRVFTP